MRNWYKSGEPWVWTTAGAVALSLVAVYAVVWLTAARGLTHWWPKPIAEVTYQERGGATIRLIGEIREKEEVSVARLREQGYEVESKDVFTDRYLIKLGNKDLTGVDFKWYPAPMLGEFRYPDDLLAVERREWGNFYGHLKSVVEDGKVVAEGPAAWDEARKRLSRSNDLFRQAVRIEKVDIGKINYALEKIRLGERRLEIDDELTDAARADFAEQRKVLEADYLVLQEKLDNIRRDIERDSVNVETSDGQLVNIPLAKIADMYMPNAMSVWQKIGFYVHKFTEFVTDDPREANTEGGIFPAIFGTVMMVLLMSVMVTPLGIMAAVYMREYAKQGPMIRAIRISVNNLAGVPSIVYGVFGLGFFVYVLGGSLDALFFPRRARAGLRQSRHPVGIADAGDPDPAGGDRRHRGGPVPRAAHHPRGQSGAGCDQGRDAVANGAADGQPGDDDRPDPGDGARRRRGRAADAGGRGQARAQPAAGRQLPLRPPRAQVHAPGLSHLRRRLPEPQRRGGTAAGLRHGAAAGDHHRRAEPVRDQFAQPLAREAARSRRRMTGWRGKPQRLNRRILG
jgi:ABC-type phosphate transport system auxiliary subunit